MAKEATSIYIDDSAIRVLTARGRQLRKWATMSLDPGLVSDGVILDQDAVADKVRQLWHEEKIGTRRVIAGINGINCLYRTIVLPELPRNLLPEAVRREVGRALGVSLEQLHISWQAIPSPKGEALIYLAASPKNSVDSLVSTLRKAGLNPYLMDLKPLALARASTESSAIIIDLQPTNLDIVISVAGMPEVVRSVPLAREATLETKVPIIKEELERTATFYNSSHTEKPLEPDVPLLVCGDLAEQEDSWKLLLGRHKRPVQALLPATEMPEGFPACQYVANMGLTLKEAPARAGLTHLVVNLNALPEVYQAAPRPPLSQILYWPVLIVGIALVILGAYVNMNGPRYTSALRAEWESLNQLAAARVAQARTYTEEMEALTQQVTSLEATAEKTVNAFTATRDGFAATRDEVNDDLAQINRLPAGLDLGSVKHSIEGVTLSGWGYDETAVFSYARGLRESGRFSFVALTDMHRGEVQTAFTIYLGK